MNTILAQSRYYRSLAEMVSEYKMTYEVGRLGCHGIFQTCTFHFS